MKTHRNDAFLAVAVLLAATAQPLYGQSPTAEDKFIAILKSSSDTGAKANACRELKVCGTERSIPLLAALLTDAELSHSARFALESMPYPAASAALRETLDKTSGLVRSGVIDSLGQRRDALAAKSIAGDLGSKDQILVAAAATALGKIGTPEAASFLTAAHATAVPAVRTKIDDGLLLCADRLRVVGQPPRPPGFMSCFRSRASRADPRGALRGRIQAADSKSLGLIAAWLADADPMLRAAAAGELRSLSDGDLCGIADRMGGFPATSQVAVLAAMGIRGRSQFTPTVLAAVTSPYESVRLAAARALGTVGDVTALPALVKWAAAKGPLGETARQSLEIVCGPKIDDQILTALRGERDPLRRVEWIGVIEVRRPASAVPLLLGEAIGQNAMVAARALAALGKLAAPGDIPALAGVCLKIGHGPLQEDAERALVRTCLQLDATKRAQPLLAMYRAATPADQLALLPLLGRVGGADVRPLVQTALASNDPATYEAGVRAISNWPDAASADQLWQLAQTAKELAQRQWALRAFVRVVSLPGGASYNEKLEKLKQAMQLSQTDHERLWVIQRAAAVRSVECLRFLVPYLGQPDLAQQTCASVVELAHHKEVRDPSRAEFNAALKKVLTTAKDTVVLELRKTLPRGTVSDWAQATSITAHE